jgi:hypothetical protein
MKTTEGFKGVFSLQNTCVLKGFLHQIQEKSKKSVDRNTNIRLDIKLRDVYMKL